MFVVVLQLEADQQAAMEALHPAWAVVLEQVCIDPRLACCLLSVSRGMRSTVKYVCSGGVSVYLYAAGAESLKSFERWLPRQAALLHHLDVADMIDDATAALQPKLEAELARTLWESNSTLQLELCVVYSGLLVQQLAALASMRSGLTALTFHPEGGECADKLRCQQQQQRRVMVPQTRTVTVTCPMNLVSGML